MSVIEHFVEPRSTGQNKWQAKCPCHDDSKASLSITATPDKWLIYCHAGCHTLDILGAVGLTYADLSNGAEPHMEPTLEYHYHDESGKHVYTVVRKPGKQFRQKQANGEWSMKGITRYPYNLPAVLSSDTVFIVEGEKDVETLRRVGIVATCNSGGAGKWDGDFSKYFEGKTVYIFPDNDKPGIEHAEDVQSKLGHGKIIALPVGPKGDVSDWFAAGGNADELMRLVEESRPRPQQREPLSWLGYVEERTDNALATRFIDKYGDDLRFVPTWRKWLVWDGKRFSVDSGGNLVLKKAREFARSLWDELGHFASDANRNRQELAVVRTFCKASNKDHGIQSFLNLAKADERIAVSVDELNANPHLLNVQNGTYDLSTGHFRQHDRADLITQVAAVSWGEIAECPKWLETLDLVFDGNEELIHYVQQLLGYSLSADAGEHILPIAYGGGCNGKSTIWNVVLDLAGDYGTLANEQLLLGSKEGHPTEKAQLYQRRVVAISEPEQGSKLRESRIKELTGDSLITARRMHEDFWTFRRSHTFWLSTNHLPSVSGTDDGIWRRVKLIPFTVDLRTKVKPINGFSEWLVANEGPGILNWLVAGFESWKRTGFIEPKCVQEASGQYRNQEDEIAMFLADCCIVGAGFQATAKALFAAYQQWGGKSTKTAFGKSMAERFERQKPNAGEFRKQTLFHGVGVVEE